MRAAAPAPPVPTRKRRVALGVFDTFEALRLTVDALAKTGVDSAHLVLVIGNSSPNTLAGTIATQEGRAGLRGIGLQGRNGTALQIDRASQPAFAAQGLLYAPFETWGAAGTTRTLNALLDRGGCVLVALVDEAENEREVLEILLAHSIDQVQQHDIIAPAAVGGSPRFPS